MAALGSSITINDAFNKRLISTVLLLLVGSPFAAAQGNASVSDAGYPAFVRFRINTTNPVIRVSAATFSVWNPNVTRPEDYSLGKVSIVRADNQNVAAFMEAGYIVFPARYGDNSTRFYIRWKKTEANGTTRGCFDLDCEGFVPTSTGRRYIGSRIGFSEPGARTRQGITPDIYLERSTGNWVLERNALRIGYWPGSLFSGDFNAADLGGEVYHSTGDTTPTSEMGNGMNPTERSLTEADIIDIIFQDINDLNDFLGIPN